MSAPPWTEWLNGKQDDICTRPDCPSYRLRMSSGLDVGLLVCVVLPALESLFNLTAIALCGCSRFDLRHGERDEATREAWRQRAIRRTAQRETTGQR